MALKNCDSEFIEWASIGIAGYIEADTPRERVIATIARIVQGDIIYPDHLSNLLLTYLARRSPVSRHRSNIEQLTARERDIIGLLADGQANKQIAHRLGIADATVKNHVHSILEKLNLRSRGEAAAYFRNSLHYVAPTMRELQSPPPLHGAAKQLSRSA